MKIKPWSLSLILLLLISCGPNFYFVVRERGEESLDPRIKKTANHDKKKDRKYPFFKENPDISCKAIHTGFYLDPRSSSYKPFQYSCGEVNFHYPDVITLSQYNEIMEKRGLHEPF
jgi:hypothetical protein